MVRECGHDVTCPVAKEVIYTLKERAYVEQIEKAFNYASKVLLDFLMEEKELVARLRCVRPQRPTGGRVCPRPLVCGGTAPSLAPCPPRDLSAVPSALLAACPAQCCDPAVHFTFGADPWSPRKCISWRGHPWTRGTRGRGNLLPVSALLPPSPQHPSWGALCGSGLSSCPRPLASPARRSIKRYFLMDQGDFFVHFMDLTEEELKKPVDDITPTRLEALLELALRMSTANTDPFKDDLKVSRRPPATLERETAEASP